MQEISFASIPGIRVGHAQDMDAATGCTVLVCEEGAVAGVDVRGGAPGTRETDLLRPENYVDRIHAILLGGGSAFGLDAAAGVMEYLEKRGVGFDVGVTKVPIVCGAVLFDLTCGDYRVRPDKTMGFKACLDSEQGILSEGSVGAGTGATIGKFFGMEHAMKSGLGTKCVQAGGLMVGAMVAVNCLGDIVDPASGRIIAGAYRKEPFAFLGIEDGMARQYDKTGNLFAGNTTIGVVVTNAALTKAQALKVASMTHNGYARTMRPAHTMFDGDTVFCLSTGAISAEVNVVGMLAARMMEQAILAAVKKATSLCGYRAYKDICGLQPGRN